MTTITQNELGDIQGLVVRGYGNLDASCFIFLAIDNSAKVKQWLLSLLNEVTTGLQKPDNYAVNLALSYQGLLKLNLPEQVLKDFSNEFLSSMTTSHKQRILGDQGDSSPDLWQWGGPNTPGIDVLVCLYAKDAGALQHYTEEYLSTFAENGLQQIYQIKSDSLLDGKEHFGFSDGIGQPYIAEFDSKKKQVKDDPIKLGEILLGYENGYDRITQRPLIDAQFDPLDCLDPAIENSEKKDLGKNGTYLVIRQLQQDVELFWSYIQNQSTSTDGAIKLASKMVGRWPSGTALVQSADVDRPDYQDKDDFLYHDKDSQGFKCPLGAHIRRTNPRDSLKPEPGSKKSIEFSNRHRILRRGRPYGKPYVDSMNPLDFIEKNPDDTAEDRGLVFVCLNANISRQFEFVQHTWSNNPNFNGLYQDPDPIIGSRNAYNRNQDIFTIQKQPVRERISGLPDFVKVLGGAYFFLPSIRALKYFASLPGN